GQPKIRESFESLNQSSHLQHLNILRTYGLIEYEESLAIEREYIEGDSLDMILDEQGFLNVEDCLPIFKDLCAALSYAHKRGAIHGEINPKKIFLEDSTKRTVLGSFQFPKGLPSDLGTNRVMGNPTFFSPEQCQGDSFDASSDIYSLGSVFYMMLTGLRPFRGKNVIELVMKHIEDQPAQPRELNPKVPSWLSKLVMKMMAKTPEQRYPNCDEILAELERVTGPEQDVWNSWDDRYFYLNQLTHGHRSMTYLALDQNNGQRKVSITILTEEAFPEDCRALERRAQIISKLPEAHFPRVYQSDLQDHDPHFIEDYFDGESLGDRVREQGALDPSIILNFSSAALIALKAVHSLGLVHGDLSPETIWVTDDQQIKVLGSNFNKTDENIDLSYLGLQFISPEQIEFPRQTACADLYSLGVSLYYASTNHWPFNRRSSRRDIYKLKQQELPVAPHLLHSSITQGVSEFIMKLLAKSPKDRYQSAEKALVDLKWIASGQKGALPNAPKKWFKGLWG
ncbi:MAG: serine/threonine-protein kinase, partial [Planctomycetota bacterium]|nr:serine/threonine-protein kinase [Planctomycetota bacterium]